MRTVCFTSVERKLIDYWVNVDKHANHKVDKAIDIICDYVDGRRALHNATIHVGLETYAVRRRAKLMEKHNEALRSN